MKCKFCGCTDSKPCRIPINIDGELTEAKTGIFSACAWLIDNVCSAPSCVEKAYAERCKEIDFLILTERLSA